jgi:hypothetical protein
VKKLLSGTILAFVLIAAQVGTVFAQDTTTSNTGTIQTVTLETDATTGDTTVLVSYTDDTGATQTVRLSVTTAEGLGLVTTTTDPGTGVAQTETTVNDGVVGSEVTIDPATVIPDTTEEDQHPVGSALAEFFGVDYDALMNARDEYNAGFGVIAQALWLTKELGGDTDTFTALLNAKQSGNYEDITLADGSTPRNWGDVVRSLKKGENLGSVKSGHANSDADTASTSQGNGKGNNSDAVSTDQVNGSGGNNGNGNNANGHGLGGGGNNHGNGSGNGHGKP